MPRSALEMQCGAGSMSWRKRQGPILFDGEIVSLAIGPARRGKTLLSSFRSQFREFLRYPPRPYRQRPAPTAGMGPDLRGDGEGCARRFSISISSRGSPRCVCRCWSSGARRTLTLKTVNSPASSRGPALRRSPKCGTSRMSRRPQPLTASCSAGSRRTASWDSQCRSKRQRRRSLEGDL